MEKTRKRDFVLLSNEKQIVLKVCRTFWLKKMCQDVVRIFINSTFLAQEDLMGWDWFTGNGLHVYEHCLSHWTRADPGQERRRAAGEWITTMWISSVVFFPFSCCLHLSMCPPSYWNESWTNRGNADRSGDGKKWLCFMTTRLNSCSCLCKDETKRKKGILTIISQTSKQFQWWQLTMTSHYKEI